MRKFTILFLSFYFNFSIAANNNGFMLINGLEVGKTTLASFKKSKLSSDCNEDHSKLNNNVLYVTCNFNKGDFSSGHFTFLEIKNEYRLLTYSVNFQNNKKRPASIKEALKYEAQLRSKIKKIKTMTLKKDQISSLTMPFAINVCNKMIDTKNTDQCKTDQYIEKRILYNLTYLPIKDSKLFFSLMAMDYKLLEENISRNKLNKKKP